MKQCLTLAGSARAVPFSTMFLYLCRMPPNRFPPLDLPRILARQAAPHIVTAVPLEPSPRIVLFIDPSLFFPHLQGLTRVLVKIIQRIVVTLRRKFRVHKPAPWKLLPAVGHILAAEHTQGEHLLRGKFRCEIRGEIFPHGFHELIGIAFLHLVVHPHPFWFYIHVTILP